MFKLLVVLFTLTVGLNEINAQSSFSFGSCAKSPVIANFDITKYVGIWYEIQKIPAPFEPDSKCVTATYNLKNATTIEVDNKGFNTGTGEVQGIIGEAWVVNPSAPNQLALKFPNIPSGSYNVWDTDYTGYTLIYSCTQIVPYVMKNELIWIMSRKKTLETATVDRLRNFMTQNGVGSVPNLLISEQSC